MRIILSGELIDIFLNMDYFYNNIAYIKSKLVELIKDRYLPKNVRYPNITGDIALDIINSYYHRYEYLDTSEIDILKTNYNKYLKCKRKSSIPSIKFKKDGFTCELIRTDGPRNLVLGYRSGNCFRINGIASTLFYSFLKSNHMKILSISNDNYKDFAMILVMRNGNVLVGQGIEISKRVNIDKRLIYDVCKYAMNYLMDYMNNNQDKVVETLIGVSNLNVSNYNEDMLPFIVRPILDNN